MMPEPVFEFIIASLSAATATASWVYIFKANKSLCSSRAEQQKRLREQLEQNRAELQSAIISEAKSNYSRIDLEDVRTNPLPAVTDKSFYIITKSLQPSQKSAVRMLPESQRDQTSHSSRSRLRVNKVRV